MRTPDVFSPFAALLERAMAQEPGTFELRLHCTGGAADIDKAAHVRRAQPLFLLWLWGAGLPLSGVLPPLRTSTSP